MGEALLPTATDFEALGSEAATRSEIAEVVDIAYQRIRHVPIGLGGTLADIPLKIHSSYQREEILAALDHPQKPRYVSRGRLVLGRAEHRRLLCHPHEVRGRLLTDDHVCGLSRSARPFSTGSRSRRRRSHRRRASVTSPDRAPSSSLSVSRQTDEFGTAPYLFLGQAKYVTHKGDRPIAITWQLEHPMPADFFNAAAAIAQ